MLLLLLPLNYLLICLFFYILFIKLFVNKTLVRVCIKLVLVIYRYRYRYRYRLFKAILYDLIISI